MGACKSPRDDGKVGVPWFRAHDSSLKSFELAGYLLNVTSSLGKLSSNQWSNDSLPCHFQACPDVFPLVSRTILAAIFGTTQPNRQRLLPPAIVVCTPGNDRRVNRATTRSCSSSSHPSTPHGPTNGGSAGSRPGWGTSTRQRSRRLKARTASSTTAASVGSALIYLIILVVALVFCLG